MPKCQGANAGINRRSVGTNGFTLIELSIVLVIIGLIVGGVLVGQDLIRASEVRAQITQIEKYNSAVNTFRDKYNAIPGDMSTAAATQFGFTVGTFCTGRQGARDGNGLIDGNVAPYTLDQGMGETAFFWEDLSSVNLIEGTFPGPGGTIICDSGTSAAATQIGLYFPPAKIGRGNYVYVYEYNSANWFAVSAVTALFTGGDLGSSVSIPVIEAYNTDKKTDDGIPTTGRVQAAYLNMSNGSNIQLPPSAASDNVFTCYNTSSGTYSITQSGGAGANCALSFQFQ